MTHDLWATLNTKMYDYLSSVSLADLVQRQKDKGLAGEPVVIADQRLGPRPRPRSTREKAAVTA